MNEKRSALEHDNGTPSPSGPAQQLDMLGRLADMASTDLGLEKLLVQALETLATLPAFRKEQRGLFMLHRPKDESLEIRVQIGMRHLADLQGPWHIGDLGIDPDALQHSARPFFHSSPATTAEAPSNKPDCRQAYVCPLRWHGQFVGLMLIYAGAEHQAQPELIDFLHTVSQVLVPAIVSKQKNSELQHRQRMHDLLMRLATTFINPDDDDIPQAINEALAAMGEFTGVDRVYIFDYDFVANVCNNTYEWVAKGISPEIDNLQGVPLDMLPDWTRTHRSGQTMYVADVSALPLESGLRQILEPQSIQSLVTVPIIQKADCIGFVGFDSVRHLRIWSEDELHLLQLFAEMIMNASIKLRYKTSLQISNRQYELLSENMTDLVTLRDMAHNKLIYVSPSVTNLMGYSVEAFKQLNVSALVHPEDVENTMHIFNTALAAKANAYRATYRIRHQRGHYLWFETVGKVILDDAGQIVQLQAISRDITQRLEDQQRLAESEAKHKSVVNNIKEAVFQADRRGIITFLNPAWSDITGYDIAPSTGRQMLDFVHPDERKANLAEFFDLYEKRKKEVRYTTRYLTYEQTVRWVEVYAMALENIKGEVIGTSGTLLDMTDRIMFEERLKRQNAQLRDIAWQQSHIVRRPVSNILGLLMAFDQSELHNPDNQRIFDYLREESAELDRIIREIVRLTNEI